MQLTALRFKLTDLRFREGEWLDFPHFPMVDDPLDLFGDRYTDDMLSGIDAAWYRDFRFLFMLEAYAADIA